MNYISVFIFIVFFSFFAQAEEKLLHVSFDVTRELFKNINSEYNKLYGNNIRILQSHGGSGKQTSAIMHGLSADIVSLALPFHMELLADKGIVAKDWRQLFPNNSSPFGTHIVFLVRKNNPKKIFDWPDLIKPNIKVITANPKTSGGALWNYVAAWIYSLKQYPHNPKKFMHDLYHNTPILDSTARNSATTFIKRNIGDVLITWYSEARYIIEKFDSNYEIIEPSITVKVDIPVAAAINKKKQSSANSYIDFLFSDKGQEIISKYYYQPYYKANLATNIVDADKFINWNNFKKEHFDQGGVFEEIYH
ncbi:MAG: sulfate ABC transporter substrate-binding protein [Pseudomonadota bacterium]